MDSAKNGLISHETNLKGEDWNIKKYRNKLLFTISTSKLVYTFPKCPVQHRVVRDERQRVGTDPCPEL